MAAYVYIEYPKMIRLEGVDHIVNNRAEEDILMGVKKEPEKVAPKKGGKKMMFTMEE